jgi:hypothetical protein
MGTVRASFTLNGQAGEVFATGQAAVTASAATQIVVVIDGGVMRLYHDGTAQGTTPIGPLADLDDKNVWLGRSQWTNDDEFGGVYDDFRIYDAALGPEVIAALYEAGADHQF